MSGKISRRRLVQAGCGAALAGLAKGSLARGVGAGVGWTLLPAQVLRAYQANEKVQVALIGVGGRGRWFVETIPKMADVVALCDVNELKNRRGVPILGGNIPALGRLAASLGAAGCGNLSPPGRPASAHVCRLPQNV